MTYAIGTIEVNGHRVPAIFWADGRVESGPAADRLAGR